jgi:hypothetical protein
MESKSNSQSKARLIVLTVFIIGFAAGALSLNLYQRFTSSSNKFDPRDRTTFIINKMDDKMDLSGDQKSRIREILEGTAQQYLDIRREMEPFVKDFEPKFDKVRQQSRSEIRTVLTEKQLPKYQEMTADQDRMRKEDQEKLKEEKLKK